MHKIKSIYERAKYECSHCYYGATWKDVLTIDIKSDGLTLLLNFIVMSNEKIKSNITISMNNST